jgi:hypothetical protein
LTDQPPIVLNGDVIGKAIPGGFFFIDRPSGKYTVGIREHLLFGAYAEKIQASIEKTFTLATGETKYIRISHWNRPYGMGRVT